MPKVKISEETYNKLKLMGHCLHSPEGWEIHDPDQIAIPSGLKRPLSLKEQIQRVLRQEVSQQVSQQGMETFEEANDFDIPDETELEMRSIYEMKEEFPVEPDHSRPSPVQSSLKAKEESSGQSTESNEPLGDSVQHPES